MSLELWTLAIAVVTSVACAICGSLLLVNRQAMMSEGISHAMFPGLVIAFMLLRDQSSPLLIVSAAASGLVMVWLTQWLTSTRLVDSDAALGIVFAGMFSLGILLVSMYLRNTHFHADCIIDGNLALAPLDRLKIAGLDLGPKSWVTMLILLLVCISFITLCFKELKLMLFEPLLARRFGLKPALLQLIWLTIVSMTTVAAFNVAGAVLIVAIMIAPPAAAYLLSDRLSILLVISSLIAVISSVAGFYLALELDISPAGPVASTAGMVFLIVFAFAPKRGFVAVWLNRMRQKQRTVDCLVLETIAKAGLDDDVNANYKIHIPGQKTSRIIARLQQKKLIEPGDMGGYHLTERGAGHLAERIGSL